MDRTVVALRIEHKRLCTLVRDLKFGLAVARSRESIVQISRVLPQVMPTAVNGQSAAKLGSPIIRC